MAPASSRWTASCPAEPGWRRKGRTPSGGRPFACGAQHKVSASPATPGCTLRVALSAEAPFAAFLAFPCRSALLGLAHLFQRAQAQAFLFAEALLGQAFDRRAARRLRSARYCLRSGSSRRNSRPAGPSRPSVADRVAPGGWWLRRPPVADASGGWLPGRRQRLEGGGLLLQFALQLRQHAFLLVFRQAGAQAVDGGGLFLGAELAVLADRQALQV